MADCEWKPPENTPGREEYQCPHPKISGYHRCIFHAPLDSKRRSSGLVEEFKKHFDAFFSKKVLREEAGDFRGFVFPDSIDLSGYDFRKSYESEKQIASKSPPPQPVKFSWVEFGDNVNLAGSKYGDYVRFDYSKIGHNVCFEGAIFGKNVTFVFSEIGDHAKFSLAEFGDLTYFSWSKIGDSALFDGSSFTFKVSFEGTHFGEDASFKDTVFGKDPYFYQATFGDRTTFENSMFAGDTNFIQTEFGGDTVFCDALFLGRVGFAKAIFGDNTDFSGAIFQEEANFSSVTGRERAFSTWPRQNCPIQANETNFFNGELFSKNPAKLIFRETSFKGFAVFHETDLANIRFQQVDLRNLSFFNSQISQTKFISCNWGIGPENARYASWELPRRFWSFARPRLLLDELLYRDQQIADREKSTKDAFVFDPKIREFRIDYLESVQASDIEVLALQLKHSLEAVKDPIAAGDFHFAVMEMKRAQAIEAKRVTKIDENGDRYDEVSKKRWGRWFMLTLYKFINGYGERYGRTALWLAMLIGTFSFIYFQMNGLDATVDIKNVVDINKHVPDLGFWKQVWFSIAFAFQNVLPFKLYSNYLCAVGENLHWVRGLAMGETLVGTTLFTFFALALRRRFKR